MGRIPEDTIQQIRDRVDIADLVGRFVSLKKAGRSFKGLCPFHHEKTPSFVVSPDRGTWHCFGCGEGGNAFAFLMQHENLTFPEAVRSLAAELGIEVPETGGSSAERGLIEQVVRANDTVQAYYRDALMAPEAEEARRYLVGRGLHREDAETFGIGYAPDRWEGAVEALRAAKIRADVGARAGIVKERDRGGHYDLLRGRVVFPIQDARGRVVAFGGRALGADQEPKYLNTPESPVFRKREAFYGFPHALEPMRRKDRAVVVEGYFDRIALHRAGVEEAIATCGTALTEEHGRNLRRRTRNVVLLFDGDGAGQRAMLRALEVLLPQGLRVRAAALPGGVDPDDYLQAEGPEALCRLVDEAPPALATAIARAAADGCQTPWERADAVAEVAPLLALVTDPVERGEFTRQLALAVGAEYADVDAAVRKAGRGERVSADDAPVAPPRRLTLEDRRYAEALAAIVDHPQLAARVAEEALRRAAPDEAWDLLASALLGAARSQERLDVAALLDQLPAEAGQRLTELAHAERAEEPDLDRAYRGLQDVLAWLERRQQREEALSVTRKLADATNPSDTSALLLEKQQQLEQRRRDRLH